MFTVTDKQSSYQTSRAWDYLLVMKSVWGRSWVRAPAGAIVRGVFHHAKKLVRVSLL